jgi:hypothetical protein
MIKIERKTKDERRKAKVKSSAFVLCPVSFPQERTFVPILTKIVSYAGEHTVRPYNPNVRANCMFALPHDIIYKTAGSYCLNPQEQS